MSVLLALDPGPTESCWLVYDRATRRPVEWATEPNDTVIDRLACSTSARLAVEWVASYGMAVGAEVFETCVWIGRFVERHLATWPEPPLRVYRKDAKYHLCGSIKAKDPNVRQAIVDRYGPGKELAIGRKAAPGPLYGVSGHAWAALAVAITADETMLATVGALAA